MKTIRTLKKMALESCNFRRHTMSNFATLGKWHMAYCKACGKEVWVTNRPMPNEIDIGGSAVALSCADVAQGPSWATSPAAEVV